MFLQAAEAGGGEVAGDAVHACRIRTVRREIDLDDRFEAGIIDIARADRRVGGKIDDACRDHSDSSSSAAEHNMPFDSTPRMTPLPSVSFLPGI